MHKRPFVIGICGGSGSGKTTLLRRISEVLEAYTPSVFSMDNYYYPIELQQKDPQGIVNFDLPTALDEQKLSDDLDKLISGQPIEVKEYFFNAPPDKHVLLTIHSSPVIIVEGLFLFYYKKVIEHVNFSIYVDVDHATQLDRRIYRDQETRGYKRSDIIYQWDNHVLPCYERYIEPYKQGADFIYRNDQHADHDFLILKERLQELLALEQV
jgi:uridine kinase